MSDPPRPTPPAPPHSAAPSGAPRGRLLGAIETLGNRLPDPALLFLLLLFAVWGLSALLATVEFALPHPQTGAPIAVVNLLSGAELARFLTGMVPTFTGFAPLGIVLVALLGVGVAEHSGLIDSCLRGLLGIAARRWLTPLVVLVAIISHTAADAGYVVVIPLAAAIFHAAGRHPLAGIAAAFAGVSGGFSANFIPSALDPLLQGITQEAGRLVDPQLTVNPLCNWFFMSVSCLLVTGVAWWLTDRVVEPRLLREHPGVAAAPVPGSAAISARERRGLRWAAWGLALTSAALAAAALPADSALRDPATGQLASFGAPLMQAIVPLILLFFLVPGVLYGVAAGTIRSHRDVIAGMTKSMATMGYYIVMAFFAAQFIAAFGRSNLGILLAASGAEALGTLALPPQLTVIGVILLSALIDLFVGSASAKWLLIAPVFVPMLMQLGISPELTQAAYRIGDSSANIITPLMPYFPLVVAFCRRYQAQAGIGTLAAMMLPYALALLIGWSLLLLGYWALGLPLGLQARYGYPA
ncbi:MAG: AbgT family transporter [Pseudomonadota bacterium]